LTSNRESEKCSGESDSAKSLFRQTDYPSVRFVLANSLFLIAHFHNVIIGGVLFGAMSGYNYWVPKTFGFRLTNVGGKASFLTDGGWFDKRCCAVHKFFG